MAQWIPVIVVLVTVFLGFITYMFQKDRDRREDLIKIRRTEYRSWMQALYNGLASDNPDGLLDYNKSTNDMFLFASDSVMKAVGLFVRYMASTSHDTDRRDMKMVGALLARVILAMREDVFEASVLGEDEIRNILPINGVSDGDMP